MPIIGLPLPQQLVNGTIADAGEVMTDLNFLASNVNANAAKNGVNSDITSLTALTSIVSGLSITGATITSSTFTNGSIVNSTIDGSNTGVTQALGTSTTQFATTEFVNNQAFSTVLPNQAGNGGKFLKTDGTNATWSYVTPNVQISYRFGAF